MAHRRQMENLKAKLGNSLLVVNYERFFADRKGEIRIIEEFLGMEGKIPLPHIRSESREKWKRQLTNNDLRDIAKWTNCEVPR
jgi:hypothetical protein